MNAVVSEGYEDFAGDFEEPAKNWTRGLISIWNSAKGIATDAYAAEDAGSIDIDTKSKQMSITGQWLENSIKYEMDGWTGRYGLSLEFLLSLHLATLAPDLVDTMVRGFDTDIQVYLDEMGDEDETVKVQAYFKTDSGEYMSFDDMKTTEREDGWEVGSTIISSKDAYAIMDEWGIESKDYGEFHCQHGTSPKVLWINREEYDDFYLDDLEDDHEPYWEDVIYGKGTDSEDEYAEVKALTSWTDVYNLAQSEENKNGKFIDNSELGGICDMTKEAVDWVKANCPGYVEKDNKGDGTVAGMENIVPFQEIRDYLREDPYPTQETIAYFEHETDTYNNGTIYVKLFAVRTTVDHNWDFAVVVYKDKSPSELAEGMTLCSDTFGDNDEYEVCTACERYVENIRTALKKTYDSNFHGKVPFIARVIDSWFRDTYFVVPEDGTDDEAIEMAYSNDDQYGHGDVYGTGKRKLTGNIEFIEVDNEYLEDTGEYWTKYEMNDDGTYKLFKLKTDGTIGDEWTKTQEDAELEGIEVVKKPITKKADESGSLTWTSYNFSGKTSNEKVPIEITPEGGDETHKSIRRISRKNTDSVEYEPRIYYSYSKVRTVEQVEDGQRGITNTKIKRMFKNRKYYIYDGTSERAEEIYKDWQSVLSAAGCNDETMEIRLDNFYYNDDTTYFTEDPRNPALIGTIDINTDSLNAFSILENTRTLDADYAYRDFKELIVELDYFDKEDLSDKTPKIFTWIVPEITEAWPIRMIDKDENYYGTYIHSDEAIKNIKVSLGLVEETEEGTETEAEESEETEEDADVQQIMNAKGYTYVDGAPASEEETEEDAADTTGSETETEGTAAIGEVVSPVTGEVVGYGTYERTNTDLVKYEGIDEEEAKETVGYIQIRIPNSADFFNSDMIEGEKNTNVGIKTEEDTNKYTKAQALNAYYEEYEGVCDGYIVTIDGIKLLDGATDLASLMALSDDSFKVTAGFEANITPNIVDEDKEIENQQKENAKAEAPAVVKFDNRIFVREGTIIGYTCKNENEASDKDYSYMRVMLRNDERSLRENVEEYFDLPFGMNNANTPLAGAAASEEYMAWHIMTYGQLAVPACGSWCDNYGDIINGERVEYTNNDTGRVPNLMPELAMLPDSQNVKHLASLGYDADKLMSFDYIGKSGNNPVKLTDVLDTYFLYINGAAEDIKGRVNRELTQYELDALIETYIWGCAYTHTLCDKINTKGTLDESDFLALDTYFTGETKAIRAKIAYKMFSSTGEKGIYSNPNNLEQHAEFKSDTPFQDMAIKYLSRDEIFTWSN